MLVSENFHGASLSPMRNDKKETGSKILLDILQKFKEN